MIKTPNASFTQAVTSMKFTGFLLLFCFSLTTSAQVSFGVKGGLNLNFVSVNADRSSSISQRHLKLENGIGTHLGGFMMVPLSAQAYFKPGVTLIERGAGLANDDYRVSLYYADVPLLFQYKITRAFYLEAGPVASGLIAAFEYSAIQQKMVNVSKAVESFSFGASIGAGYFVTPRLAVTASVYRSLTMAWNHTLRDESNRPAGTIDYFPGNVSVGVEYHFKK
ncbi:MAG TPA: porin family protein [Chryseosolibacter sp.]